MLCTFSDALSTGQTIENGDILVYPLVLQSMIKYEELCDQWDPGINLVCEILGISEFHIIEATCSDLYSGLIECRGVPLLIPTLVPWDTGCSNEVMRRLLRPSEDTNLMLPNKMHTSTPFVSVRLMDFSEWHPPEYTSSHNLLVLDSTTSEIWLSFRLQLLDSQLAIRNRDPSISLLSTFILISLYWSIQFLHKSWKLLAVCHVGLRNRRMVLWGCLLSSSPALQTLQLVQFVDASSATAHGKEVARQAYA